MNRVRSYDVAMWHNWKCLLWIASQHPLDLVGGLNSYLFWHDKVIAGTEPGGTGMWGHVYPVYTGLVHAFVSFFSLFLLYGWHKWSLFLKSRGSVVLSLVSVQFWHHSKDWWRTRVVLSQMGAVVPVILTFVWPRSMCLISLCLSSLFII